MGMSDVVGPADIQGQFEEVFLDVIFTSRRYSEKWHIIDDEIQKYYTIKQIQRKFIV